MTLLLSSFALALFLSVFDTSLSADALARLTGEVVEVACSMRKESPAGGDDHAACAMRCAKNGEPMALLAADAVYVIEGSYAGDKNAKLLDFVARRVEAKGTVTERDGTKYINVAAMMVLQ